MRKPADVAIEKWLFYPALGLFYFFFCDNAYRHYYFFQWLKELARAPAGYLYALLAAGTAAYGLFIAGVAAALKIFRLDAAGIGWTDPGRDRLRQAALGIGAGLLVYLFNIWLVSAVLYLIQEGGMNGFAFQHTFSGLAGLGDNFTLVTRLNQVLLSPVVEELAFRGLIYTLLSRRLGKFQGVVLASAGFSLMHLTINQVYLSGHSAAWTVNQFIYHFAGGVVYNMLYIRCGSLLAPVTAHISYNFAASFFFRAGARLVY